MKSRRGFTLVEVLVVIGIIGVLMSILIPAVSAMRKKSRENGCANNLRQIFQATMMTTQDLGGRMPRPARIGETTYEYPPQPGHDPYGDFSFVMNTNTSRGGAGTGVIDLQIGRLWKYFADTESRKSVVYCPNDRGERPHTGGNSGTYQSNPYDRNFSYSWNYNIRPSSDDNTNGRKPMKRLDAVRRPGSFIMIYEEVGPNDPYCVNPGGNQDDWPSNRHARSGVVPKDGVVLTDSWSTDGKGNHLFFDGHVESLVPADLMGASGSRPEGFRFRTHGPLER